ALVLAVLVVRDYDDSALPDVLYRVFHAVESHHLFLHVGRRIQAPGPRIGQRIHAPALHTLRSGQCSPARIFRWCTTNRPSMSPSRFTAVPTSSRLRFVFSQV